MKLTINIPIDRACYVDEEGNIPDSSISDSQLLIWDSQCDYKEFKDNITSLVLDHLKEQMK